LKQVYSHIIKKLFLNNYNIFIYNVLNIGTWDNNLYYNFIKIPLFDVSNI